MARPERGAASAIDRIERDRKLSQPKSDAYMKERRYGSDEFFIEHPDGSRTDAELHEPILAEGDAEAAVKVTRDWLKAQGWSERQIDNSLEQSSERAAWKLRKPGDQERRADLIRFYSIMENLERKIGGAGKLADCSGKMSWPKRGVYFFYEKDENRSDTGVGPRVVRVGTHAVRLGSSSTLWQWLRQHKGLKSGGGNHRGQCFGCFSARRSSAKTNSSFLIGASRTRQ